MKQLIAILLLIPSLVLSNDNEKSSTIKEVTVYLSGAQITRTASLHLKAGMNEFTLIGLSPKIDEHSIQISGLRSVSILSLDYVRTILKLNCSKKK